MSNPARYLVRQYRPAYFSGFENLVHSGVSYEDITALPFFENFKREGFTKFTIDPYYGELIISSHYENGERWVAGFALDEKSEVAAPDGGLLRDNWRYKNMGAS